MLSFNLTVKGPLDGALIFDKFALVHQLVADQLKGSLEYN
jgi:hypothetical protein